MKVLRRPYVAHGLDVAHGLFVNYELNVVQVFLNPTKIILDHLGTDRITDLVKTSNNSLVLGSSQISLLPQLPQK